MKNNKNLQGHLFALTANVMWGLMSPIGKSALQEFSAISVTTFRMVGAAAAFLDTFHFLQTGTRESSGYAEDILRFTICFGVQSGSIHFRPFNDFTHRRFHRNHYFTDCHYDRSGYLSERTDYQ